VALGSDRGRAEFQEKVLNVVSYQEQWVASMRIVSWYKSDKVVYESGKESIRDAVIEAVKKESSLMNADLRNAHLRDADLAAAILGGADLRDADLQGANLQGANLRDANLAGANLRGANLRDANVAGTNFYGAHLDDADLFHVKFWGRGGSTKIKKAQVESFLKALGITVEE
jgi:uncharacterized protein YjbI with pentapeptide repeats